jgi:hypothetical protein
MGLNITGLLLALTIVGVGAAHASGAKVDPKQYTIGKVKVREISSKVILTDKLSPNERQKVAQDLPIGGTVDAVERIAKIISTSRDLVALGEDIYKLVQKGKPSNVTSYTPISVIPRVNGVAVDLLDTESWKEPVKKTYEAVYENLYGADVVSFRYSVVYSYGGSYDGKGAYLTSVQIIPEYVKTLYGFDFTATMKLGGIQNQGTKAYPVAAATIHMEYTISSVLSAEHKVDSFFVTGSGGFKKF